MLVRALKTEVLRVGCHSGNQEEVKILHYTKDFDVVPVSVMYYILKWLDTPTPPAPSTSDQSFKHNAYELELLGL